MLAGFVLLVVGNWSEWSPTCEMTCNNTMLLPQTRVCSTDLEDRTPVCEGNETRDHDCGSDPCPG